jgi:poly(A) polymerase
MFFFREKVIIRNREAHTISRKHIDPDALQVLYRLSHAGFTAYLVGGGVRDLLLGRQPKDFDISTDAHPSQIRKLFRNCYLVGRRFRLAHVVFGRKVIEVSTFRKPPQADEADESAPGSLYQQEDNTFGTPEEDAKRRDFTVNGLFYDIRTFSVIDYVGGLRDLDRRTLRSIGDPNIRFREDPVRMMRAVRFAARLGLSMDWNCRRALRRHHGEIQQSSTPRLQEEIMRLFGHTCSATTFQLLWEHRLMSVLLPEIHAYVEKSGGARSPLFRHLAAFDQDAQHAASSNGLRMAVLLAPLYRAQLNAHGTSHARAQGHEVARTILDPIANRMTLPRQTYHTTCMLLDGLQRFEEFTHRSRRLRMAQHELFPEALALRRIEMAASGESPVALREWEELAEQAAQQPPATSAAAADTTGDLPSDASATPHASDEASTGDDSPSSPRAHQRRRPRRRQGRRRDATGLAPNALPTGGNAIPSGGDADRPADAG